MQLYILYIHIAGTYIEYISVCRVHVHCMFNDLQCIWCCVFGLFWFQSFFYSPGTVTRVDARCFVWLRPPRETWFSSWMSLRPRPWWKPTAGRFIWSSVLPRLLDTPGSGSDFCIKTVVRCTMMIWWLLWIFSWWSWISGLRNPKMWRIWFGLARRTTRKISMCCSRNLWIQTSRTETAGLLSIVPPLQVMGLVSACCWKLQLTKMPGRGAVAKRLCMWLRWMESCRSDLLFHGQFVTICCDLFILLKKSLWWSMVTR